MPARLHRAGQYPAGVEVVLLIPGSPGAPVRSQPIAFRRQNFGDYEIPSLHLKEGLEPTGRTGFGLHVRG
ncbi:hypothetical protein GCM10017674_05060 [Streptomyces gardneri]|uniref:Uncharacterized protein n=1 Tax=Streptomyces gardneri TaxID=66892 RepID=A0A4Y3RNP4_9ACTN|nr:hypothetical protein SGA01_42030 [Streptomyces gardneri]GHG82974.1 hypothetical protein GCM10017674_05060 [Streptomyces gardneri]